MSQDQGAAARRIMNQLGAETRIPVVNIREGDIGILLGFPLSGLFIGAAIGVDLLGVALFLIGFFLGVTTVYAAPPQQSAWSWLQDLARYVFKRPRVTHSYRPEDENPTTEGGLVAYMPFSVEESTQDLTNMKRAWPGAAAIERTDGAMEGYLELEPSNMDFAMSDDWMTVQERSEEFANNELDFPITFHATTKSFPAERLVDRLENRLSDEDVKANPVFEDLLEEYREQRPDELADSRQLHYYLGVEVDRMAVYQRYDQDLTPGEKLTQFPLIGFLFTPFVTRREDFHEDELRAAMFEKLDSRIRTVRSEFVEKLPGWSARRLTTPELFVLNAEFWNGEEYDEEATERLLREEPIVGQSQRRSTDQ